MVNPFNELVGQGLVCISTGAWASIDTQKDLTHVKQIGEKALKTCLERGGEKLSVIKINTFETKQSKKVPMKEKQKAKPEINLLQRVSQVIAAGGEVSLNELVGEHECTDFPPSLFDTAGCLRQSNKSTLIKVIMEDSKVKSLTELPDHSTDTAVIIDAMFMIHRWSFTPRKTFRDVANRYLQNLLQEATLDTTSILFCCDRYDHSPSLKAMERARRGKQGTQKLYDIKSHLSTPAFCDFVSSPENKAALLSFLSELWSGPRSNSPVPLYLSGGFSDETRTVMVDDHGANLIPELGSTHEEADNRIVLHALYSAEVLGASRIIIHANDTDVIVLCIYYCSTRPALKELWVKTDQSNFIPVHDISNALGRDVCLLLPFFHSFSGKDDTSFLYGIGKRKLWKALPMINANPLRTFAENSEMKIVNGDLIESCNSLVVHASNGSAHENLADLRTQKFLTGNSGLLLNLPPTADALEQHIKRAALATIVCKSSHISKPDTIDITSYGWYLQGGNTIKPVYMTKSAYPANLKTHVKCMCKRKCAGNCACSKNNVPCYSACYCQGKVLRCSRATYLDPVESDSE